MTEIQTDCVDTEIDAPTTPNILIQTGFLRLYQIIGNKKAKPPIPPLIPVSKSTWWQGVKDGKFPAPVKLSERCTAWRTSDIRALIERLNNEEGE